MAQYNYQESMLPSAGGSIMAMRGGGVPDGFNPDVSLIQLPPSANHITIVDMKGGNEILPMAAAATVVSTVPVTATTAEATAEATTKTTTATTTKTTASAAASETDTTTPKEPIRFILFDTEFKDFSTASNESSKKILALLGNITGDSEEKILQQIYNGVIKLREPTVLTAYPHFKRLLTNMGLTYAKENPIRPEETDIKLDFPNENEV